MDGNIASILPVMLYFNTIYALLLTVIIIVIIKVIHGFALGIVKSENEIKGMRKRFIFAMFVLSLMIISIPNAMKIVHDRKEADQFVAYCEEYKQKYGNYPEKVEVMVPEFFDENKLAEFGYDETGYSHFLKYRYKDGHCYLWYMTGVPFHTNNYRFDEKKWLHYGI